MIKIISGTYGFRDGNRVVPKNHLSEPFSLEPEKEERLIKNGIAVRVKSKEVVSQTDISKNLDDETNDDLPEYNLEMKLNKLKEIAIFYSVDASKCRAKQEVIDMINESISENEDIEDAEETELNFEAKPPVNADSHENA